MSLGDTLVKIVIGVAIAKGVSALTKGNAPTPEPAGGRTAGRGTPVDRPATGQAPGQSPGLDDLLNDIMGSGGRARTGGSRQDEVRRGEVQQGGGLGDLLDQMSGQKRSTPRASAPKGGLDDLLGQLTGRAPGSDAAESPRPGTAQEGVGDLLDQVLGSRRPGAPVDLPEPQRETELSAALMLRAVIQAVKCDGALDADEKARLMQTMGQADAREVRAVQAELQRPVDIEGLARAVPAGLEPQIYVVSLMAINLDHKAEADYLHKLAGELDLSPDQVNAIHDRAQAPRLYR